MRSNLDAITLFGGFPALEAFLLPSAASTDEEGNTDAQPSPKANPLSPDVLQALHLANAQQIAASRRQLDDSSVAGGSVRVDGSTRPLPFSAMHVSARFAQSLAFSSRFAVSAVFPVALGESDGSARLTEDDDARLQAAPGPGVASAVQLLLQRLSESSDGDDSNSVTDHILALLSNFASVYPAAVMPHALAQCGGVAGFADLVTRVMARRPESAVRAAACACLLILLVQGGGGVEAAYGADGSSQATDGSVVDLRTVTGLFALILAMATHAALVVRDPPGEAAAADDYAGTFEGEGGGGEGANEQAATQQKAAAVQPLAAVEVVLEMLAALQPTLLLAASDDLHVQVQAAEAARTVDGNARSMPPLPFLLAKVVATALSALSAASVARLPPSLLPISLSSALALEQTQKTLPGAAAAGDCDARTVGSAMQSLCSIVTHLCCFLREDNDDGADGANGGGLSGMEAVADGLAAALIRIMHATALAVSSPDALSSVPDGATLEQALAQAADNTTIQLAAVTLQSLCSHKKTKALLQAGGTPALLNALLAPAGTGHEAVACVAVLQALWSSWRRSVLLLSSSNSSRVDEDGTGSGVGCTVVGQSGSSAAPIQSAAALLAFPPLLLLAVWPQFSAGSAQHVSWVLDECTADLKDVASLLLVLEQQTNATSPSVLLFDLEASLKLLVGAAATYDGSTPDPLDVIATCAAAVVHVMRVAPLTAGHQAMLLSCFMQLMASLADGRRQRCADGTSSSSSSAAAGKQRYLHDACRSLRQQQQQQQDTASSRNVTDTSSVCSDDNSEKNASSEGKRRSEVQISEDILDALTTSLHTQRQQPRDIPDDFWTILDFVAGADPQSGRYAVVLLELSTGELHDSALTSEQRERCAAVACTIAHSAFCRKVKQNLSADPSTMGGSAGSSIDWQILAVMLYNAIQQASAGPARAAADGAESFEVDDDDDGVFCKKPQPIVLAWLAVLAYAPVEVLVAAVGPSPASVAQPALLALFESPVAHHRSTSDGGTPAAGPGDGGTESSATGRRLNTCVLLQVLAAALPDVASLVSANASTLLSMVDSDDAAPVLRVAAAGVLALGVAPALLSAAARKSLLALHPQQVEAAEQSVHLHLVTVVVVDSEPPVEDPRLRHLVSSAAAFIQSLSSSSSSSSGQTPRQQQESQQQQQQPVGRPTAQPLTQHATFSEFSDDVGGGGGGAVGDAADDTPRKKATRSSSTRRPTSATRRTSNGITSDGSSALNDEQQQSQRDEGREMRVELAKLRRKSIDSANLVLRQEQTLQETQALLHAAHHELRSLHAKTEHERQTLLDYTTRLRQTRANLAAEDAAAALRVTEEILLREENEVTGAAAGLMSIDALTHALTEAYSNNHFEKTLMLVDVVRTERAELQRVKAFYGKELQLSAAAVFLAHDRIKEITIELHRATLEASKHHQLTLDYAKLRRETVDLRNMLGIGEDQSANAVIASRFSKPCKTPEEIERTNMQFRLQTAIMRSSALQKELDRSDAQRAAAELDAVEARQKTKKVLLMHKNDQLGMDWARSRMKRLENERTASLRSLADANQQHRESIQSYQEETRQAQTKAQTLKREFKTKIASLEAQLATSQARTIELAGEVRRKDMIISQLSNKLELLRSAPSTAAAQQPSSRGGGGGGASGAGGALLGESSLNLSAVSGGSPGKGTGRHNTSAPVGLAVETAELKTFFAWKEMRRGRGDSGKKKK